MQIQFAAASNTNNCKNKCKRKKKKREERNGQSTCRRKSQEQCTAQRQRRSASRLCRLLAHLRHSGTSHNTVATHTCTTKSILHSLQQLQCAVVLECPCNYCCSPNAYVVVDEAAHMHRNTAGQQQDGELVKQLAQRAWQKAATTARQPGCADCKLQPCIKKKSTSARKTATQAKSGWQTTKAHATKKQCTTQR